MPSSDTGRDSDMVPSPLSMCGPEHALEVGVAEHAGGVEALADGDEAIPERVERPQRRGRLEMELAPVRAALVRVHDRLHLAEVGLVLEPVVDVHRDVAGFTAVCGAQGDVVGGD